MHFGVYNFGKNYRSKKFLKYFDELAYISAFLGPVLTIPQLVKIWEEKSAASVSIWTWAGYLGGAIFWLLYGLFHKEKPIIVANLSLGILALLIVISIIIYS